ncbi:MAG: hypothetical protein ACTHM1_08025 [Solirubrobacteraceae bacterium]
MLLYTDSRGFFVAGRWGKHIFGTYAGYLSSRYSLTYSICPEKFTTIIDFLEFVERHDVTVYDAVVMHCGIVDFSPRPLSSIRAVHRTKSTSPAFARLAEIDKGYYATPFETQYMGEPTINLYSPEYLVNHIIPELRKVPNLLWVNSNRFVPGWDGNYAKGRPANIDTVVDSFDRLMLGESIPTINLKEWCAAEVQEYTIDNIHFTREGFQRLAGLIDRGISTRSALESRAALARR